MGYPLRQMEATEETSEQHVPAQARVDDFTYCTVCKKPRPPRTHHCKRCDRCVLRMDHHCPWLGNCIGLENMKYYVLLLGYACITLAYTAGLLAADMWTSENVRAMNETRPNRSRWTITSSRWTWRSRWRNCATSWCCS